VYEDQPQGTVRPKKERQIDPGLYRVQFIKGFTDTSVILGNKKISCGSPQFGSERGMDIRLRKK
jgi:hypothetical protein